MKKIFLSLMSLVCVLFATQDVQAFQRGSVKVQKFYEIMPQILAGSSGGTGFFIEKDLIVTNFHVLRYASIEKGVRTVTVKLDGKEYAGTVILQSTEDDVAFIKIREQVGTPVRLGDYSKLKKGDELITYGHPKGGYKIFRSHVNKINVDSIEIKGSVAGDGHSGSPMFTRDLEVLGVATSSSTRKPYRTYGTSIDRVEMLLGDMYLSGQGVPLNARLAKNWYRLAASKGSLRTKLEVAKLFDTGQRHLFGGTVGKMPRDLKQAVSIYEDAMTVKNSFVNFSNTEDAHFALFRLASIYDRGEGPISRDIFRAVNLYKQFVDVAGYKSDNASSEAEIQVLYRLGQIYEKGEGGIPQDLRQARNHYRSSLNQRKPYGGGDIKGLPSPADIAMKIGDIQMSEGKLPAAKDEYIRALELSGGNHPEAQRKLENVNKKLNKKSDGVDKI